MVVAVAAKPEDAVVHFLLIAHDGTDKGAAERRRRAQPAHRDNARRLFDAGQLLIGGPLLDEAGRAIGSMGVFDFPSRVELMSWLSGDPYVTEGVWQRIEIRPFEPALSSLGQAQPS